MKRAIEIADLILKVLSCVAILGAGGWAVWVYWLGGWTDWQNNITIETKVLPYRDDLRLLIVHVKSKNPRTTVFELDKRLGDSYQLRVRKVSDRANANDVIDEDAGHVIATVDLMARTGDQYEFLPGAEMDDMRTIVLPLGSTVALTAEMAQHNGTRDAHGKLDTDFISASAVVRIEP